MIRANDLSEIQEIIRKKVRRQRLSYRAVYKRASKFGPISYITVCNLLTGETRFPRLGTVLCVLHALDLDLYIEDVENIIGEEYRMCA